MPVHDCIAEGGTLPDPGTEVSTDWSGVGASHWAPGTFLSLVHLRPSDSLMTAIHEVRRTWSGPYTCLHLRTEGDWNMYFADGSAKQSVNQVIDRFTASFAKSKSNDPDAYLYARLFASQRLFIAGEHTKENIEALIKVFEPMYPLGVFAKATIGTSRHPAHLPTHLDRLYVGHIIGLDPKYSWDKKEFSNAEAAVIDREICAGGDQFVGNAFSGWSIQVYGQRVYSPSKESIGTYLGNGQYNWMTNPLSRQESWKGPLNPFCPAAFELDCPHYIS